jgi:hypothetical protein
MKNRRSILQGHLDRLYEQLAGKENALILAPSEDKLKQKPMLNKH